MITPVQLVAVSPSSEQFADWQEHHIREYARDKVTNGSWPQAEALIRARADNQSLLPQGLATTGHQIRRVEFAATGQLVGWIWVGLATDAPPDSGWLFDIEIVPEHRGQGYGRAVLALAETSARELGCTSLGLHVFAHNAVARHLYENSGFELTGLNFAKSL